jgi:L,D-peptidoglycan transpeptidase YkuD (ErfK/YbiS/YcfS/YnhG family)
MLAYKHFMELIVSADGLAIYGGISYRCALGRGGIRANKCEGDGATPAGHFRLIEVRFRPDRIAPFETALPIFPICEDDGWCDDPVHPDYNQPIVLPHLASHERLWRDDSLYDVIVVTDHNQAPTVPGAGSAIFAHISGGLDYPPTEGCVAFSREDLISILSRWSEEDRLSVVGVP